MLQFVQVSATAIQLIIIYNFGRIIFLSFKLVLSVPILAENSVFLFLSDETAAEPNAGSSSNSDLGRLRV